MKKLYSLFMLLLLLVSNGIQAQDNSYNMIIEMTNGTKISIGPNDVKNVTFNDGQLTVTGEDLQSWLTNIAASVEASSAKISTLQKEVYSWQSYIETWTAAMETMQANMVNANNQIIALNTNTASNSARIDNLKTLIEQLGARVDALEKGGTEPEQPAATITVTTYDASDVTETSAMLNGSVSASNTTKTYTTGFFLATSGTPSNSNYTKNVEAGGNKTANYSASVAGLSDNTTYRFRAYVLCDGEYYYGETKIFTTTKATTGTLNGHEWVDLGLPSGTKWATCNVGASKPEEYGGYYAWGETKEISYHDNYIFENRGDDISGTKYDVAHIEWGSTWQIPSRSQFQELFDNCSRTWMKINGVYGTLFTGTNGLSVFFPAGGHYDGETWTNQGYFCHYWSSTLFYDKYAYEAWFDGNRVYLYSEQSRVSGSLIRPVTK